MVLKPFTNLDWDGFAGATCFADGGEPLIGEGRYYVVVIDAVGVFVLIVTLDEQGQDHSYTLPFQAGLSSMLQRAVGRAIADALELHTSDAAALSAWLLANGFEGGPC